LIDYNHFGINTNLRQEVPLLLQYPPEYQKNVISAWPLKKRKYGVFVFVTNVLSISNVWYWSLCRLLY